MLPPFSSFTTAFSPFYRRWEARLIIRNVRAIVFADNIYPFPVTKERVTADRLVLLFGRSRAMTRRGAFRTERKRREDTGMEGSAGAVLETEDALLNISELLNLSPRYVAHSHPICMCVERMCVCVQALLYDFTFHDVH